jgi:uncharacterized membrane protein YhaH (DUF805 family)
MLPFVIIFMVLYFASFLPLIEQAGPDGTVPDSAITDINWAPMLIGLALMSVVSLIFLIPQLSVTWRRLHDMGQPGAWALLSLLGLGIVPLIMAFFDSQPHDNEYGPDPKAGERAQYPPANYAAPAYGAPQAGQPQYGQPPQPPQYGQPPQPPAPPQQ